MSESRGLRLGPRSKGRGPVRKKTLEACSVREPAPACATPFANDSGPYLCVCVSVSVCACVCVCVCVGDPSLRPTHVSVSRRHLGPTSTTSTAWQLARHPASSPATIARTHTAMSVSSKTPWQKRKPQESLGAPSVRHKGSSDTPGKSRASDDGEDEDPMLPVDPNRVCLGCERVHSQSRSFVPGEEGVIWRYATPRGGWCRECHTVWRNTKKAIMSLTLYEIHLQMPANKHEHMFLVMALISLRMENHIRTHKDCYAMGPMHGSPGTRGK